MKRKRAYEAETRGTHVRVTPHYLVGHDEPEPGRWV